MSWLTGVNRALVGGLLVMAQRRSRAGRLGRRGAAKEPPGAITRLLLGPRQCWRPVGQADLGARLLSSDDPHEVGALALRLDEFNAGAALSNARCSTRRSAASKDLYGPDRKGLPAALVIESEAGMSA
jgi:single-stranded-DNA-specific exonuclease